MTDHPGHTPSGRSEKVSLGNDFRASLREDLQAEFLDFQHRMERSLRELCRDLIRQLPEGAAPLGVPCQQVSAEVSQIMAEEVLGIENRNIADAAGSRAEPGKAWASNSFAVLPGSVSTEHSCDKPPGSAAPVMQDIDPGRVSSSSSDNRGTTVNSIIGRDTMAPVKDHERNAEIVAEMRQAQEEEKGPPNTMFGSVARIVERDEFDYVMGVLLSFNALAMGVQVELEATSQNTDVFVIVDVLFCTIFTLELALRIAVYKNAFYRVAWNNFDFVIGVAMLVDLFVQRPWETASQLASSSGRPNIALLKMLKLCRVARLVRMIRLIPALKQMVYLVMASLSSFFWTGVLMLILMYCLAIYFCEQGTDWRMNANSVTQEEVANMNTVTENWGTIGQSILSLFMALTGGDDWRNLIGVLGGDSVVNLLIFIFWIAFATLVLLNLVTGVFVEGAQRILKEDKEKEVIRMAAKLFQSLETGNDRALDFDEFRKQLDEGKLKGYCAAVGISPDEAGELFRLLDKKGKGRLLVGDFVDGCLRLRGPARSLDLCSVALSLRELKTKNNEHIKRTEKTLEGMRSMLTSFVKHIGEPGSMVNPLS